MTGTCALYDSWGNSIGRCYNPYPSSRTFISTSTVPNSTASFRHSNPRKNPLDSPQNPLDQGGHRRRDCASLVEGERRGARGRCGQQGERNRATTVWEFARCKVDHRGFSYHFSPSFACAWLMLN